MWAVYLKKTMNRLFFKFLVVLSVFAGGVFLVQTDILAQKNESVVNVYVLGREGCKHCQAEKLFFNNLSTNRDDFKLYYLDLAQSENLLLWEAVTNLPNMSKVTPITLIGKILIQGFDTPDTTGRRMIEIIEQSKAGDQWSFEDYLNNNVEGIVEQTKTGTCSENCEIEPLYIKIPFYGVVDVKRYSLGLMALILGFVDGFNPCAMWVLVTFLLILLQIGDRKKMWQFVSLFLIAEAVMYSLILTVWYQTWDFIGLDGIVTPLVGLIAIGGGTFFLWEWKTANPGECKVTDLKKRNSIQTKIKSLTTGKFSLATAIGIITLALSVNVIEFACSIGIPQAFTKILQINQLGWVNMVFYNAIYILAYMFDDLLVFGIALYSFEKIGLTSKYTKWSNLIGGILMLLLGMMLMIKPEWLRFN